MAKYEIKDGVGIIPEGTTVIESAAFKLCDELTSVVIPNTVTKIKYDAFYKCTGLTNIIIPNSVTEIESGAFAYCTGLTSIVIPASVTILGDIHFYLGGCTNLTKIVVAEGNPKYDSRDNCNAIIETESNELVAGCGTTVIPDSVTSIRQWAFHNSDQLETIAIPASLKKLSRDCFTGCPNLKSITVAEGNEVYDSRNDCNAIIRTENNTLIIGGTETIIPDSVTEIGPFAFDHRAGLKKIVIPDSVTKIGDCAFNECSGLTDIVIPASVTTLGDMAFAGCTNLKTASILGPVKALVETFSSCKALDTVTFGAGIKKIERAFPYDSGTLYDAKEDYYLKTINVPAKKSNYYKTRLPEKLHGIIVELPAEKKK